MTLQSRPPLVELGAEFWLPSMIAVSIVREMGAVITALICAGRVGTTKVLFQFTTIVGFRGVGKVMPIPIFGDRGLRLNN
ncbi:MAG: ABC transporter permease [Bacteroidia bacterium]